MPFPLPPLPSPPPVPLPLPSRPARRAVPIGEGGERSEPPEPPVPSRPHTVPSRRRFPPISPCVVAVVSAVVAFVVCVVYLAFFSCFSPPTGPQTKRRCHVFLSFRRLCCRRRPCSSSRLCRNFIIFSFPPRPPVPKDGVVVCVFCLFRRRPASSHRSSVSSWSFSLSSSLWEEGGVEGGAGGEVK